MKIDLDMVRCINRFLFICDAVKVERLGLTDFLWPDLIKKKPKSNIEITLRILFEYAMHRTWAASSDIEISSIAKFSNQFIHVLITLRQIDVVVLETNLMGSFFFAVLVRFKCFSKPTICQQVSRFHIFASIDLSIARDYFVVI